MPNIVTLYPLLTLKEHISREMATFQSYWVDIGKSIYKVPVLLDGTKEAFREVLLCHLFPKRTSLYHDEKL